jgi:antirestriction protein
MTSSPTIQTPGAEQFQTSVWIGCLTCYNDGRLVGEWHDAVDAETVTPEQIHGRTSDHEELWCLDTDGLPVSHETSPAEAAEAAEWGAVLAEVDDSQRDALVAWVRSGDYIANGHGDIPSLPDFEERYAGEWDGFENYAADLFEDLGYAADMPEHLAPYFNMRSWARDLAYDHTIEEAPGGGVFVFRRL